MTAGNGRLELLSNSSWRLPVDLALRSGARASGAMQKGLDGIAFNPNLFAPLDPLVWIQLASEVVFAAIGFPLMAGSVADGRSNGTDPLRSRQPVIPPSSPFFDPTRKPGWGKNPFRPPQPRPAPADSGKVATDPGKLAVRAEDLQALIDQDAVFQFFSLPEKGETSVAIPDYDVADSRSVIGFHLSEILHRFNVNVSAPTNRAPLAGRATVGESVGTCSWRWMLMPDDFVMTPGEEPPPTRLNPVTAQRFAMLDGIFKLGGGEDGFRGSGAGQTFPVMVRGRAQLRVTAVGTLSGGFGKFKGNEDGFFIYCGTVDPSGFHGSIILRVGDLPGRLQTHEPLPALEVEQNPEHGVTWLTVFAQAIPSALVDPLAATDDQPGVIFRQEARLVDFDFATRGARGLECTRAIRQVVGTVTSRVAFDTRVGGGAPRDPLPFAAWREFSFVDALGKPVGGFTAEATAGSGVFTDVMGVKAIRFGSTGRVLTGTGRFEGMSAMISENSLAVLDPHASSSVYTLCVDDPEGRFFAHAGVWRDISVEEVQQRK
jgi:hypothetical protein